MNIVEARKDAVYCDSSVVAKKFGFKHAHVIKVCDSLIADIIEIKGNLELPLIIKEDRNYRGADYTAYLMTRDFFSLLCMRFKGKSALEWQMKFNTAFYEMEKALLMADSNQKDVGWSEARSQSKMIRREQTDVIDDFVKYATNQGSKSAKHYFKHITNATYSALQLIQHKNPKLRDTLDVMQLAQLMVAENRAKSSLRRHMNTGADYHAVFKLVKEDLIKLADEMALPKVKEIK